MPVPQEGPAEHIRNALQILVVRKETGEALWEKIREDSDAPPTPDRSALAFLSMADLDAIIERLKSALATL